MDVEFMLYDSLEVSFCITLSPDLSDVISRLSVRNW